MNDAPDQLVLCADCAYWRHGRENEGACRRRAPEAGASSEEVAHWPRTHGVQGCGDGARASSQALLVTCGDCAFWRRPAHGFSPTDRGDMPVAWWAHAGYCGRHAPIPTSEPGLRGFWRATSSADGCGQGSLRPNPAPTGG